MEARAANQLRLQVLRLHAAGCPPREIALRAGCHLSTVYRVLDDPAPDRRVREAPPDPAAPPAMPPGLSPATVATLRLLAAEDPDRSALELHAILHERRHPTDPSPVPSLRTVARALRAIRHQPAPATADPADTPAPDHVPPVADADRPPQPAGTQPADVDPPDPDPPDDVDPPTAPRFVAPDWLVAQLFHEYDNLPDDAASVVHEVRLLRLLNRQAGHELFFGRPGPRARRLLRAQLCEITRTLVQAQRAAAAIRPRDASLFGAYVQRLEKALDE